MERGVLPARGGPRLLGQGLRRVAVLRRALRHRRGQLHVLRAAAGQVSRAWVERTPPQFEFSLKLYRKFTHPTMYRKPRSETGPTRRPKRLRALAAHRRGHLAVQGRPDPIASAHKLGALSRSFRRASSTRRQPRVSGLAAPHVSRLSNRGGAASSHLERQGRGHAATAERVRRGVGADRRAEIQVLDPPELSAEREGLRVHAPARQERRELVAPRARRRSLRLPLLEGRVPAVRGYGERHATRSCGRRTCI